MHSRGCAVQYWGITLKWKTGPDKTDGIIYYIITKLLTLISTDYVHLFYSERKDVKLRMRVGRSKWWAPGGQGGKLVLETSYFYRQYWFKKFDTEHWFTGRDGKTIWLGQFGGRDRHSFFAQKIITFLEIRSMTKNVISKVRYKSSIPPPKRPYLWIFLLLYLPPISKWVR